MLNLWRLVAILPRYAAFHYFFSLISVSLVAGGEIISPIGAVRRLLPSASLWETLGQGRVPT